jgi:hypothetical protein
MRLVSVLIFLFVLTGTLNAQSWDFVREKDGIRLYTRSEPNSPIKSYRGEVVFQASADRICNLLGNADQRGWWAGTFSEVRVLAEEKGKFVRYYVVCPLPILLSDRDIVIETREMTDPSSGNRIFQTRTLNSLVPESPDRVRITNYFQTWTVEPSSQGRVRVSLEGSIDPGGNIPAWLTNQVMTNTPVRIINNLREWVMSGKPT